AATCFVLSMIIGINLRVNATVLLMALGLAIGPQIMGHGSMNFSVKYISPTLLSTLILAEPLLATLLAYLIFNELPSISGFAAMSVVIAGISMTWRKKSAVPKVIEST
ncbi:MAG TPA: EamA family transporter, partial [Balneolales bacterium]|nr:EamA family transporter [Balneolales bacterium]